MEVIMGFSVKFNWVLQINPPEIIETQTKYKFEKMGNRIFPTNTPIDLIDTDRNAIAKIKVINFQNENKVTRGEFKLLKIYRGEEQRILTNYWIENQ